MRAHQIMTKSVISVTPDTSIVEAANIMLRRHVSGLPVIDAAGKLLGIVSEGDFIRRSEIGTQRERGRWHFSWAQASQPAISCTNMAAKSPRSW